MHKHLKYVYTRQEHVTYNVYVDRFSIIVAHLGGGMRTSEIKPAGAV